MSPPPRLVRALSVATVITRGWLFVLSVLGDFLCAVHDFVLLSVHIKLCVQLRKPSAFFFKDFLVGKGLCYLGFCNFNLSVNLCKIGFVVLLTLRC